MKIVPAADTVRNTKSGHHPQALQILTDSLRTRTNWRGMVLEQVACEVFRDLHDAGLRIVDREDADVEVT